MAFALSELSKNTVPASWIRPINSFRPMLSKSITITSNEHSRIFSHGTLKENASLNTGFRVHLNIGVFRFSILLSPNCNHTFTYGSKRKSRVEKREKKKLSVVAWPQSQNIESLTWFSVNIFCFQVSRFQKRQSEYGIARMITQRTQ